ncbi:hypothetical protein JCM5350_004132 [Sporobolomyces pararoseus]
MPLAYVALPLALGLVTAVAITVIVVEVLPRLAEDREKRLKENKKRRVRAKSVASQSGTGNKVEDRCYTAGRDGKEWGYEVRKRRNRKNDEQDDQSLILLQPIETERHELQPQHVLANPSDFELSSPDVEHSRRPLTTPLIPIDNDNSEPATPPSSSTSTPPLVSPPLVPASSSDPLYGGSPFFDYERESSTPQGDSPSTLRPRAPPSLVPHDDNNPSTTNSSTFSSPLIVDHSSLSLNGSPSFSDDLEIFGQPGEGVVVGQNRKEEEEEVEEVEDERRARSETFGTESVSSKSYSDWSRLSDDDDGEEDRRIGGGGIVDSQETRSATDEWERIEEDRKGFGLGLGGEL